VIFCYKIKRLTFQLKFGYFFIDRFWSYRFFLNMTAITSADVESRLKSLNPSKLDITDLTATSCATSFEVLIVSDEFKGKRLLQRHRLVNDALKDVMPEIHAFTQKTLTIEEWEKSQE